MDLDAARQHVMRLLESISGQVQHVFAEAIHTTFAKGATDFSTETDLSVDRFLTEGIRGKFPAADILTEETAPEGDDYNQYRSKEALWIIDPIDGTTNFYRGEPNFGISVGLVSHGKTVLGIVHLPATQETFWAQADKPEAYRGTEPIHVSSVSSLNQAVIAGDLGHNEETHATQFRWMGDLSKQVRQIKFMGSAVSVISRLAQGQLDAYLHSDLRPWDVAAAVLIATKAGAQVSQANGDEWDVFSNQLLLTNSRIHQAIITAISHDQGR